MIAAILTYWLYSIRASTILSAPGLLMYRKPVQLYPKVREVESAILTGPFTSLNARSRMEPVVDGSCRCFEVKRTHANVLGTHGRAYSRKGNKLSAFGEGGRTTGATRQSLSETLHTQ